MELTTIGRSPMKSMQKLTGGRYRGRTFRREQPQVWVEQWTDTTKDRPTCWIPLHVTHLEIMAGRPVPVR